MSTAVMATVMSWNYAGNRTPRAPCMAISGYEKTVPGFLQKEGHFHTPTMLEITSSISKGIPLQSVGLHTHTHADMHKMLDQISDDS